METTILELANHPPEVIFAIWPAVIGAVGAVAGGALSMSASRENRRAQQDANRANLELAKYQNEWNLAQWNRENAYNTPAEQMKRLRQAGLNPNLAYGNGSVDNVAASSPSAAPMKLDPYLGNTTDAQSMIANVLTGLQAYESYKQSQNQTKLGETQVDFLKADILNKRMQTEKLFEEKMGLSFDNYVKKELREYNVEKFKLEMDDLRASVALKNAQKDVHRLSLSYTKKQMEMIAEQIQKVKQEVANLRTSNQLTREQITREKLDNALKRQGINPNDPMLYRMIAQAIQDPDYGVELVTNLRTLGVDLAKNSVEGSFDVLKTWWNHISGANDKKHPHGWGTR